MAAKVKKEYECKVTCDLHKGCKTPFMKRSGDVNAEILFIGEAPGADEDQIKGEPFVGDSGKLLRSALDTAKVTTFAMTNAVRCRPPGNRDPKTTELKSCKALLETDIKTMPNLKLLVLVGNYAMQSVLGYKGILDKSGTLTTVEIGGKTYQVMCLMHPSHVLREQKDLKNFMNHVGRIPNALNGSAVDETDEGTYIVIDSLDKWDELEEKIRKEKVFVYDIETSALSPFESGGYVKCISFSVYPREAYAVDTADTGMFPIIEPDLKAIMEDPDLKKVGHNVKFDNLWLREKYDFDVKGTSFDTSISQYLLDENESHGLKSMAWKYSKLGGYEQRLVQGEAHLAEGPNLLKYGSIDADLTNRIYVDHKKQIDMDEGLRKLNENLLIPVADVLTEMERRGVRIDAAKVKECSKAVDTELSSLETNLFKIPSVIQFQNASGLDFNPRSATQLREVLFKYEGLKPTKKTAKARLASTERAVLEYYRDQSKLCDILCEYSVYSSMKSKMIKELETFPVNGRIHTNFWLTETSTGRSSSDKPNLQNVTKGKKDVVGIRKVFVADDGFDLVEADYNQHELRCMAELAEDDVLYNAVRSGDVHRQTASLILGKAPEEITDDERRDKGKTFNFGLTYGLTVYGIMKRLNCSEAVAQSYLDKFFSKYNKTKLYMDATTLFVKENGYVKSRTGRYRRFPVLSTEAMDDKSVREAINMPVQALAGDILLYSLIGIDRYLKRVAAQSYLCLEVHDSILLNLHKEEHHLLPVVKHIMLNYWRPFIDFKYELGVDFKIGSDWGSMQNLEVK